MGNVDDRIELGALLREARLAAGVTTRGVKNLDGGNFSSGHISSVETGRVTPSWGLVETYIRHFNGDRRVLQSAFEKVQGRRAREDADRVAQNLGSEVTADSLVEEIRRTYQIQALEHNYRVDARGVITELNIICTVRQKGDSRYFAERLHYYTGKRGELDVRAGMGCTLLKSVESGPGIVYAVFELDNALVDDPALYSFSCKAFVNSDQVTRPVLRYHFASEGTPLHSIRVQFTEPALPDKIWWSRSIGSMQIEEDPEPDRVLAKNSDGFYFHDFRQVQVEHCGLAWSWNI
ncbi:helix-turn-helix domain-containing protein [Streptomyces sp. NBC_00285]|uniref:helix-turn-helix domain-containing protein n=1 Tax=Streptomyces sp. NBC_00285 TaxID=2975700 RepID=UPI002E28A47C|nr:helix-turn-helix transcriptional regulator [Streptomyces sp. NBC_00285]